MSSLEMAHSCAEIRIGKDSYSLLSGINCKAIPYASLMSSLTKSIVLDMLALTLVWTWMEIGFLALSAYNPFKRSTQVP